MKQGAETFTSPDQGFRVYPALGVLKENALDRKAAARLGQLAQEITSF